jgi:pilus assembly protein CpaB
VLAVGSEIKRPKNNSSDTPEITSRARTVTLEVTPRMGEVVAVAARLGSLSLALRSFATDSREPAAVAAAAASSAQRTPIWAGDISRAVRELPRSSQTRTTVSAPAPLPTRPVAIYRGSEKSEGSPTLAQAAPAADGAPPIPTVPAR